MRNNLLVVLMNRGSERREMINGDIRVMMAEHGLKNYEVAYKIGITETTFCVWMRKELVGTRRERMLNAIHALVAEKESK